MKLINQKNHIRLIIISICLINMLFLRVYGQISEGGVPPSFYNQPMLRSGVVATKVPIDFYIEDLRETDNWKAREGGPTSIAKLIRVDYTMSNSGFHSTLPGGERIWQLNLKAQDAVALMLYYKEFYIPEGGKLFIYRADKTQVLGAYTHVTNPAGGLFATEFVGGDELVLEYVYPEFNAENPRICIDGIGYGYNTAALREFCGITTYASSGSCMVNINCEEGDAWQNEKKGVCQIVQIVGSNITSCSGSLMNNTAEDFKPFILTAEHCSEWENDIASSSDMMRWSFYFHKELEGCGNNSAPVISKTITGCKLLVKTGTDDGSDGMLLLLNSMIPENYDVYYNGWDRRDIAASSGVSIHHPNGDYKKISTYDKKVQSSTFFSADYFNGEFNACWNVLFKKTANGHAVTEGGSSGSPLFNENKLVVGTLSGGTSTCSSPDGLNLYGKLSYHWNRYRTDSTTRMDFWLNPIDLNVQTLAGRFIKLFNPPVNLKTEFSWNKVYLTWSAPSSSEKPVLYNVFRNNEKIGETDLMLFIDDKPEDGYLDYSVSAIYANGEESSFTTGTVYCVRHKAPSDLKAERLNTPYQEVELTWDAPVYEQEIYWGEMFGDNYLGTRDGMPFYFGHTWSSNEVSPYKNKSIKAVRFIPVYGGTYEIYISQGNRNYRQEIDPSLYKYFTVNTIALDVPFIINDSEHLIVSIYVSNSDDEYPAACDNGPVIDKKGNIVSFDGETWYKTYDENSPDRYDFNFIVSAIVSSESGLINTEDKTYTETTADHSEEFTLSSGVDVRVRVAERSTTENAVSLRSSAPAEFPEIEKYRIYRSNLYFRDVSATETSFLDNTNLNYYYEITAVYSNSYESERSNRADVIQIDIEDVSAVIDIMPTNFSDYVKLKGSKSVSRVEVISVSGNICLLVNNPDETIDTSSLSPGFYFFRIYDNNNRQKVIKAVKSK